MKKSIDISVTQASRILNSSGKTIVNYCHAGKLKGKKNPVTGIWQISLQSVLQLQKNVQGVITDDLS